MGDEIQKFEQDARAKLAPAFLKTPALKDLFDKFFARPIPTALVMLGGESAMKIYSKARPQVEEFFVDAFQHPEDAMVQAVLNVFEQNKFKKESVYRVADYFTHKNPVVRFAAVHATSAALPRADQTLVPQYVQCLKDADAKVRRAALLALGQHKAEACVPDILALTGDADRDVRWAVFCSLKDIDEWGKKHVRQHLSKLKPFLDSKDEKIKLYATDLQAFYEKGASLKRADAY